MNVSKCIGQVLLAYQQTINRIDDYFEYSNQSAEDKLFVRAQLAKLTNTLREIHVPTPTNQP